MNDIIKWYCLCSEPTSPPSFLQAGRRDNQLLIWDVETDAVKVLNAAAILKQDQNEDSDINITLPELADAALNEQLHLSSELLGRHPVAHYWGANEPKLLVTAMASFQDGGGGRRSGEFH